MGNIVKTSTHLYVDDRNQVHIVIEYVNGDSRDYKTEAGDVCEPLAADCLKKLKVLRSGKELRLVPLSR